MTNNEKILQALQSLSEDASVDEAIERLYLLRKLLRGIDQADCGDVMEHETFMIQIDSLALPGNRSDER